jgi:glycosyltransferase involved in cell wall biosynthesis
MRILVLYQYFGTPKGSWSTRIYELCRRWVQEGHEVEVITAPYEKSDIQAKGFISRQMIEGIQLTVIDSGDNNRLSVPRRAWRAMVFAMLSIYYALFRKYDVLLASSGPITIGLPLLMAKLIRRKKTVFEVRDLWPSGGVELGLIKDKSLIRLAYGFEKRCYHRADLVVTASPGQQEHILRRFPDLKTMVIPNASDNVLFGTPSEENLPKAYQGYRLLTHIGSLGKIHNIQFWMEMAEALFSEGCEGLKFVFIGDGADRKALKAWVKQKGLEHIHFLGLMPKEELPKWVQQSYATLFATTDNPVQDTSSPNKIFDSFAAGVPIIQTSKGWIKDLVDQKACGINLDLKDVKAAALQIKAYLAEPELRNRHGENAKRLALEEFDRDILAKRYLDGLKEVVAKTNG